MEHQYTQDLLPLGRALTEAEEKEKAKRHDALARLYRAYMDFNSKNQLAPNIALVSPINHQLVLAAISADDHRRRSYDGKSDPHVYFTGMRLVEVMNLGDNFISVARCEQLPE